MFSSGIGALATFWRLDRISACHPFADIRTDPFSRRSPAFLSAVFPVMTCFPLELYQIFGYRKIAGRLMDAGPPQRGKEQNFGSLTFWEQSSPWLSH